MGSPISVTVGNLVMEEIEEIALPRENQASVIYEVPYTYGKVYIGETTCQLETRLKKHKDTCIKGFTDKSAITEHAWMEDHPICWDDTRILQHASQTMELVVKKAIYIRMTPESLHFNCNGGYDMPDCWMTNTRSLEVEPMWAVPL